jgi:hypothetical protein
MICSGLRQPIADEFPWGIVRDEASIQVAFGSGDGGFVILTKSEARIVIDRITIEGEAIVCGQKLTDNQATELARTLEELLKAP